MNRIKELFNRIKQSFYLLFNKQKVKLIEETITDTNSQVNDIDNIVEDENSSFFNGSVENKKDFFIVYENVKKGILTLDELMIDDLIKVKLMMEKEINLIDKKTQMTINKINNLNNEINTIQAENESYCNTIIEKRKKQ